MCSWLVEAPNLRTKTPTPKDKKRAQKMMVDVIKRIATEKDVRLPEKKVEAIANAPMTASTLSSGGRSKHTG
jgi:hypothetical protein